MLFRSIAAIALFALSSVAFAQGKIAVGNLEQAILQTDFAQQQLEEFAASEAFAEDKAEFDRLNADLEKLIQDFQRDQAAMSEDQQLAAQQKLRSKQSDLEYVANKLQTLQQQNAQRVLAELAPLAQQVLQDVIKTEGIGLLLNAQSALYSDVGYNLTAKVTDKLNQQPSE